MKQENISNEVGLAFIDIHYPHLILYEISDSFSLNNTLNKIHIYNPKEIIISETNASNGRLQKILRQKSSWRQKNCVIIIPNIHFDPSKIYVTSH